jgi:hypothetical protein
MMADRNLEESAMSAQCYHGQHEQCTFKKCGCDCHVPPEEDNPPLDQPMPIKNAHPYMQDLVLEDIEKRKEIGIQRYGTLLQPHNGRDFLRDAYEECIDQCMYLRGCLYERDGK